MRKPEDDLRKIAENTDIPDSLKPENMMKMLKNEVKRETMQDDHREEEHKMKSGKNRKKIAYTALAVAAAAAIVTTGVFYGKDIFRISNSTNITTGAKNESYGKKKSDLSTISLKKYSDRDEIVEKIYEISKLDHTEGGDDITYEATKENTITTDNVAESTNAMDEEGKGSGDYYNNNDQVEGVKEADLVITDGKAIYSLGESCDIVITKVDGAQVLQASKINLMEDFKKSGYIEEEELNMFGQKIYLHEDKLIAVFSVYKIIDWQDDVMYENANAVADIAFYTQNDCTYVFSYDIKNPEKPELSDTHKIEGELVSSRVSDGYVYVITNRNLYDYVFESNKKAIEETCIPRIDDKEVAPDSIYYDDLNAQSRYEVVASFEIGDKLNPADTISTACTYDNQTYVSGKNIYTISEHYNYVNNTSNSEIHKISYEKGKLTFEASAKVDGYINDQFSLDEYEDYLRVVYTSGNWDRASNELVLLNSDMEETGKITGIADGEQIKSARFVKDTVYFITFKRTDPLFIADLSDVTNPYIVSEIKMPGFSDYLHKWDEDTLLGIGYDATEDGVTTGFKISLYDVSNPEKIDIQFDYTSENAYRDGDDYKDMMIAPDKSIIGMTVTSYEKKYETVDGEVYDYIEPAATAYHIYKIDGQTVEDTFSYEYTGKNLTVKNEEEYNIYDIFYRGLYVGDYLYIVTMDKGIAAIDMKDYTVVSEMDFN